MYSLYQLNNRNILDLGREKSENPSISAKISTLTFECQFYVFNGTTVSSMKIHIKSHESSMKTGFFFTKKSCPETHNPTFELQF